MQEMSENFIDSFGFQDDEFTESEENVRCIYKTKIVCTKSIPLFSVVG